MTTTNDGGGSVFQVEPFIGPLPIRFGMTEREVDELFPGVRAFKKPYPTGQFHKLYDGVKVLFSQAGLVTDISLFNQALTLRFKGQTIFGDGAVKDPVSLLAAEDPHPVETVGILVFKHLGISTESKLNRGAQRTFSVLSRESVEAMTREAKPVSPKPTRGRSK